MVGTRNPLTKWIFNAVVMCQVRGQGHRKLRYVTDSLSSYAQSELCVWLCNVKILFSLEWTAEGVWKKMIKYVLAIIKKSYTQREHAKSKIGKLLQ